MNTPKNKMVYLLALMGVVSFCGVLTEQKIKQTAGTGFTDESKPLLRQFAIARVAQKKIPNFRLGSLFTLPVFLL